MNDRLEAWLGLRLEEPWWLVAAALVPLAVWWRARRGHAALNFAPAPFLVERSGTRPLRTLRVRLRPVPPTLQALALVLVVVALARPVERTPLPLQTEGIDIVLCVDVSSSMTAEDLADGRDRLGVAKSAAERFVRGRPHDRIGLLTFARFPDVRCPPTLDHEALRGLLRDAATVGSDSPEDATGIGTAVAKAAEVLTSAASPSRVVILLTDGEENVATSAAPREIAPQHAAQLCAELGVRVYAISAGAQATLDTTHIQALAERTGGAFYEARDAATLDTVYATIDALETAPVDAPLHETEERFGGLLAAAVLLFIVGRTLDSTVLGTLP